MGTSMSRIYNAVINFCKTENIFGIFEQLGDRNPAALFLCLLLSGRKRAGEGQTMLEERDHHDGGCHCGAVRFRVRLDGGFASARRCNCSICRMRGAVALSALLEDFTLLQGADKLAEYRFNTNAARHYFCSVCGIYTHYQRRSNPHQFGINAACLDGVSPFDFAELPVGDGVNHPTDTGRSVVLGTLRYEPLVAE
jgi:hypothetical protein